MSSINKKAMRIAVAVLFCWMFSGIVRGEENRKGSLSLRFDGGFSFIDVKDINDCIQSRENNPARYPGIDWKKTRSDSEFSLEVIYFLSERIGIGVGAGYAFFNNAGSYQADAFSTYHEKWDWKAIPVFSNLYVFFPIRSRWTLLVKGGTGYYFSALDGYKDIQWDDRPAGPDYGISWGEIEATSGAFAVHGGIGLDFRISEKLSFSMEADYRFIKMKDFKGTERVQTYQDDVLIESYRNEGYLWHCEFGSASIHDSFFQNEPLSHLQVQRHAAYDLSGLALHVGVKYFIGSPFSRN